MLVNSFNLLDEDFRDFADIVNRVCLFVNDWQLVQNSLLQAISQIVRLLYRNLLWGKLTFFCCVWDGRNWDFSRHVARLMLLRHLQDLFLLSRQLCMLLRSLLLDISDLLLDLIDLLRDLLLDLIDLLRDLLTELLRGWNDQFLELNQLLIFKCLLLLQVFFILRLICFHNLLLFLFRCVLFWLLGRNKLLCIQKCL